MNFAQTTARPLMLLTIVASATVSSSARGQDSKVETLITSDGVNLGTTFYPSREKQHATPVIILHDYKENRAAYHGMAQQLQNPPKNSKHASFAVLTVDLRGHGDSTKQQGRGGAVRELDAADLRREDFLRMAAFDLEAVRKFLVTKNDSEEVNINKLSIIGAGLGANVATLFAAKDWSAPVLAIGKQGQDVKSLILVSPRWRINGLLMRDALAQRGVQRYVAMMLMYGADDEDVKEDVMRIKGQLERFHPEPESSADPPNDLVVLAVPNTSLQGGRLLSQVGDRAVQPIADFIDTHVTQKNHEWFQRRNRIE